MQVRLYKALHNAFSYKTKQFFFVLIKLSIVVGAFYFIYNKLVNNASLDFLDFVTFLNENNVFSTKNIVFLLFLSSFNWFLEILKWQNLASFAKKTTFVMALQQSLGSLTASLFTPNRIGEYGAKAIYFKKQFRKRILLLNLIGNLLQMTVTVVFGIIGFSLFVSQYPIEININRISRLLIIIVVLLVFSFFGIKQKKYKIKGFSLVKVKTFFKGIPLKITVSTLLIPVLRYLVFSFQFWFLLYLFGAKIDYYQAKCFTRTSK